MKQETAVQWLVDQVEDYIGLIPVDIIEQAKAMEKEQIIDAHGTKTSKTTQQGVDVYEIKNGQHYYNETYGK